MPARAARLGVREAARGRQKQRRSEGQRHQSPASPANSHALLPRRPVELLVMRQDRPLKLLKLPARLDAELLDEQPASLAVALERLGLTARSVEREHELAAQPLAQRVLVHERLELGNERARPAQIEFSVEQLLGYAQAQLVQPADLRHRLASASRSMREPLFTKVGPP
jgi:hypothetical protein